MADELDIPTFARWMGVIQEVSRTVSDDTKRFYYSEMVKAGMTTEQFNAAARAIATDPGDYKFPPLQRFLDHRKAALEIRPEHQLYLPEAEISPEELQSNKLRLAKMVAELMKAKNLEVLIEKA